MRYNSKRTYIIAEAGVNHNGNIALAHKFIEKAHESGADAVKFQTFKADDLVTKNAPKASYQKKSTLSDESQWDMLKNLELSFEDHADLFRYTKQVGIDFLSSPFDMASVDILLDLNVPKIKIPSGEITNVPLLRKIGSANKEIILSTGMSLMNEIENALEIITSAGSPKEKITILHCNTEYPSPICDVNLRAMCSIRETLDISVGYSDHTMGIEIPIAAAALGATIIEKHFTLDKTLNGPDQKASLSVVEFKKMVDAIRNVEIALGDGIKRVTQSEAKNLDVVRKFIVAKKSINTGEVFSIDNLTTKRTGKGGCNAALWDLVIGKKAPKNYLEDEGINWPIGNSICK